MIRRSTSILSVVFACGLGAAVSAQTALRPGGPVPSGNSAAPAPTTRPAQRDLPFEAGETLVFREDSQIPREARYSVRLTVKGVGWDSDPNRASKQAIEDRAEAFAISSAQRRMLAHLPSGAVTISYRQDPETKDLQDLAIWAVSEEDARHTVAAILDYFDTNRRPIYERVHQELTRVQQIIAETPDKLARAKQELTEIDAKLAKLRAVVPVTEKVTDDPTAEDELALTESATPYDRPSPAPPGAPNRGVIPTAPRGPSPQNSPPASPRRPTVPSKWSVVADYILELQKQRRALGIEVAGIQARLETIQKLRENATGALGPHLDEMRATEDVELAGALIRQRMTETDLKNTSDYYAAHTKQLYLQQSAGAYEFQLAWAQSQLSAQEEEMQKYGDWNLPIPVIGPIRIHPIQIEGRR